MNKREPVEKKPYEKPAIRRVELHPEESMAAGCKTVSQAGPSGGSCTLPAQCFDPGS